jgi:SAM-dependent methyltransferase
MESVDCTLCGASNAEILFTGRDLWYGIEGHFPVCRCRVCGLIYLSPRPSVAEIADYYPAQYAPYRLAEASAASRWQRWNRRYGEGKKVRAVEREIAEQGKALDIGCATGDFLERLRERGWQVAGVETSAEAAAYGRARLGLDIFTGHLEEAHFPDSSFSLVTMWHVLEHLHDPFGTLMEVARITRPEGTLVLAVPDPGSLEARLFGRFWAGWGVPRHLHIFSRSLLKQYLSSTGWRVKKVRHMTGRHWLFNLSLRHWVNERIASPPARRLLLGLAASLPVRLLTLPLFVLVEKLHKGSIMVLFAVRAEGATR